MRLIFTTLLLLVSAVCSAQFVWHNPAEDKAQLQGQIHKDAERSNYYHRFPDAEQENVRKEVWDLSRNSAGLSVKFSTNSPQIFVRYTVDEEKAFNHMPATGKSGLDLYATDNSGNKKWCAAWFSFNDTITYNYANIHYDADAADSGYEYQLYLPPYNTVLWMEIGVAEDATFEYLAPTKGLPIIAYGTSITQGACASRPAMIWTSIISRDLDMPLYNIGFSGNGRLEPEVIDIFKSTPAAVIILDCLPNIFRDEKSDIVKRTIAAVKQIREEQPTTPIIIADHLGYPHASMQGNWGAECKQSCEANLEAYTELRYKGDTNVYHLKNSDINLPNDATIEAIHPSDWGMRIYADAYEKLIKEILNQ